MLGKETTVIAGGDSKTESVELATKYIAKSIGAYDDDILITHDAIRPFVTQRIIDDNIETVRAYGAASTVMTTNDTIIVSTDGVNMSEVPRKYQMFAEQTPQTYRLTELLAVFTLATNENTVFSDETALARLFLRYGGEMRLVKGEYSNMKIINPYDLDVANALLVERTK